MLMAVGLALIIIGVIALLWPESKRDGAYKEDQEKSDAGGTKVKGGAIVMIGPIPIVIGSDFKITLLLMLIALTIMITWGLIFKI